MNQRQRELIEMLLKQAGYKEEGKMWVNHNIECAFGIKELFPESTTTLPVEDVNEIKDQVKDEFGKLWNKGGFFDDYQDFIFGFVDKAYLAGAQQSGIDIETFKDAYVERNKEVNRLKEALEETREALYLVCGRLQLVVNGREVNQTTIYRLSQARDVLGKYHDGSGPKIIQSEENHPT